MQVPKLPGVGGVLLGRVVASRGLCVKVFDEVILPLIGALLAVSLLEERHDEVVLERLVLCCVLAHPPWGIVLVLPIAPVHIYSGAYVSSLVDLVLDAVYVIFALRLGCCVS